MVRIEQCSQSQELILKAENLAGCHLVDEGLMYGVNQQIFIP